MEYFSIVADFMKYTIEKYGLLLTWFCFATLIVLWKFDVIVLALKA